MPDNTFVCGHCEACRPAKERTVFDGHSLCGDCQGFLPEEIEEMLYEGMGVI